MVVKVIEAIWMNNLPLLLDVVHSVACAVQNRLLGTVDDAALTWGAFGKAELRTGGEGGEGRGDGGERVRSCPVQFSTTETSSPPGPRSPRPISNSISPAF